MGQELGFGGTVVGLGGLLFGGITGRLRCKVARRHVPVPLLDGSAICRRCYETLVAGPSPL